MFQFLLIAAIIVYAIFRLVKWLTTPKIDYAKRFEEAIKQIAVYQYELKASQLATESVGKELGALQEQFEKLRFSKISGDVKFGQKAEHLLPFLDSFPYKDDEIKGMYQPVDLIVFRPDEIVFVEIKTGAASLTEKERRIRDNIKAGRVRFEVHRLNEKGVSIK